MEKLLWRGCAGIIIGLITISCGITELDKLEEDDVNGVWHGPSTDTPVSSQSITYVSAFDYPEGYDWRSDSERGEVKCSLVVFKAGIPMLKVPVGNEYNVSPDPDMHRVIDGHLYTDFSTPSHTVIKKDGKPLFSYPKAEMLYDFKVSDGDVYTLGHTRYGGGFSFRINGEVVLERESGYTIERIIVEDTTFCIAFSEPVVLTEGEVERYYLMRGGKVSQVALRDDIKKVWDISIYKGEIYYLASLTGIAAPVLVSSQGISALSMPSSLSIVSCRMHSLQDGIFVEGVLSDGKQVQSVLWDTKAKYNMFPKGMIFSSICQGDDVLHCAMNPASGTGTGLIYRAGESLVMPDGYVCMSRSAMDFASGILSVGLSSISGEKPVLWIDGQLKPLDVNGYISCFASQKL